MVTLRRGWALQKKLEFGGHSFTRLGKEQRLTEVRNFLINADCYDG